MPDDLRDWIAAQFSGASPRADVWRAFDRVLDTEAFLNLGYSRWYQLHPLGSCQRRLADVVAERLAEEWRPRPGDRLLDLGCGRGGPALHLASDLGVAVAGVDLVPHNVRTARANAADASETLDAAFVVGDATALPVASGAAPACTVVDALVYVPERAAALAEVARVLEPGGVLVLTDLVARDGLSEEERRTVARFAAAWDLAEPARASTLDDRLADAGLEVLAVEDLTPNSVGRFRRWTTPFLALLDGPTSPLLAGLLRRWRLDPSRIGEQVRRAHAALPHLEHRLVVARAE